MPATARLPREAVSREHIAVLQEYLATLKRINAPADVIAVVEKALGIEPPTPPDKPGESLRNRNP